MDILWALSDGSKQDMDAWARTGVFEVFMAMNIQETRMNKIMEKHSQPDAAPKDVKKG